LETLENSLLKRLDDLSMGHRRTFLSKDGDSRVADRWLDLIHNHKSALRLYQLKTSVGFS